MDKLNEIWSYIQPWIPTIISVLTAIGAVCYAIYKIVKLVKELKSDTQKTNEQLKNDVVSSFKNVVFKHDIAPLVESKLKSLDEKALAEVKDLIKNNTEKYEKLINILSKFSAFFDDSITISQETKNELKTAISEAKTDIEKDPEPVESEIIFEEPIVEKKEKKVIKR